MAKRTSVEDRSDLLPDTWVLNKKFSRALTGPGTGVHSQLTGGQYELWDAERASSPIDFHADRSRLSILSSSSTSGRDSSISGSQIMACGARIPHVEHHFPRAISLLLPDRRVLSVAGDELPIFVLVLEFVVAVGISQVAGRRHFGSDGCPGQGKIRRPRILFPHVVFRFDSAAVFQLDSLLVDV